MLRQASEGGGLFGANWMLASLPEGQSGARPGRAARARPALSEKAARRLPAAPRRPGGGPRRPSGGEHASETYALLRAAGASLAGAVGGPTPQGCMARGIIHWVGSRRGGGGGGGGGGGRVGSDGGRGNSILPIRRDGATGVLRKHRGPTCSRAACRRSLPSRRARIVLPAGRCSRRPAGHAKRGAAVPHTASGQLDAIVREHKNYAVRGRDGENGGGGE
ncbi:unnamed protein product [Prorocentrum cordatum]|uniref:Uncharacterized protein n=1 Tax=Prorocentrum cordatum TaxID=2364126 RepID=A0ABN9WFW7_9DINO|nr:unnamed protein product [Polarella glacialis]